jgi:hypothetical protein
MSVFERDFSATNSIRHVIIGDIEILKSIEVIVDDPCLRFLISNCISHRLGVLLAVSIGAVQIKSPFFVRTFDSDVSEYVGKTIIGFDGWGSESSGYWKMAVVWFSSNGRGAILLEIDVTLPKSKMIWLRFCLMIEH